nr:MAG TPA: hypothetical protein [Caudoviricetes sp.]
MDCSRQKLDSGEESEGLKDIQMYKYHFRYLCLGRK